MGDQPVVGLWLRERTDPWDCEPWLRDFCGVSPSCGEKPAPVILVRDPAPLGLPGFDLTDVHSVDYGWPEAPDPDDLVDAALPQGLVPPAEVAWLHAVGRGRANQVVLGHLALFLAQRHDALIDVCYLLGSGPYDDRDDEAQLADARAVAASLPGGVWEVPYLTEDGDTWYRHVCDREAFAAWLDHPGFELYS
ncbi:hypothetical protein GCM10020229_35050 [Kitasatospora albolonga]|uniref:DUF6368 family protein n=1 Tax=Kitasatospora albolonga TaxID=68173 RepID=UPI0031F12DDD